VRELPIYREPEGLAPEWVPPAGINPVCTACALHEGVRTVCMPAEAAGPEAGERLLVIGSGPGVDEDRHGRPFVNTGGVYVRDILKRSWPGPVVYDNSTRCAAGARKITPGYLDACRPYGAEVLRQTRPARILCLGNEAIAAVIGRALPATSVRRGYAYSSEGVPAFFLGYPSQALRNRFVRTWLEDDLAWALSAVPERRPQNGVALVVLTLEEAQEAAEDLRMAESVTWDLETFGLPHNVEHVILNAAFTPHGAAYAYVLGRDQLDDPAVFGPIRAVLEDPAVRKSGQNLKFDIVHARAKYGVQTRADADTLLWRRILQAEAEGRLETMQALVGMAGGKQEAGDYVDAGVRALRKAVLRAKKSPELFPDPPGPDWTVTADEFGSAVRRVAADGEPKTYAFAAIPRDACYRYNGTDTISTDRLVTSLGRDLDARPDLRRVWDEVGRGMAHAVAEMEHNGILADRSVIVSLQTMCSGQIETLTEELKEWAPADFNPNSMDQVAELLFVKLGLKSIGRTPGGKPSVSAEVLEKMKHPAAGKVLGLRRAMKFKTQYADGMEAFIRDDGRIHPSINIAGTSTGRPSCIARGTLVEALRDVQAQPRGVPIEDVRPGDFVYGYDEAGSLVLRRVQAAWSNGVQEVVRLRWQGSGHQHEGWLDLTVDHRVRLTSGAWVSAGSLRPGDRLFALSRGVRSGGYARLWPTGEPIEREHRFVFEQVYGWLPENVHHRNENKLDNRPENLVGMSKKAHHELHGAETPLELREFRSRKMKAQHAAGVMPDQVGEANGHWLGLSRDEVLGYLEANRWSVTLAARAAGRDFDTFKKYVVLAGFDLTDLKARRRSASNHEVLSVEAVSPVEVFDLAVEDVECFVAGEILVHNCQDPNLLNIPTAGSVDGKLCRDIFVAPPGSKLVELDQSQIELRVAAMLSRDPVMIQLFQDPATDFHLSTARFVAPIFGVDPAVVDKKHELRQRSKCFHPDTEVLTRDGWKRILDVDLAAGEEVIQAVPERDGKVSLEWVVPLEVFSKKHHSGKLVHLKNEGIDLRVTPDHRMLGWNTGGISYDTMPESLGKARYWANAGVLSDGDVHTRVLLQLVAAVQADGSLQRRAVKFGFTKQRKIERLRSLLVEAQIPYTESVSAGITCFYVPRADSITLWLDDKVFSWRLLQLDFHARQAVVDEAEFWDSTKMKNWRAYRYSSSIEQNVDVLQALAASVGRKTRKRQPVPGHWSLTVRDRATTRGGEVSATVHEFTEEVACLSVPSTYVLVRDGGVPVVTGQTINFGIWYGKEAAGFAAELGIPMKQAQQLIDAVLGQFKVAQQWIKDQIREGQRTGVCRTWWDGKPFRERSLWRIAGHDDDERKSAERSTVNTPIQGTAAEFTNASLGAVQQWIEEDGVPAKLVLTVYDSIILEVEDSAVSEVVYNGRRIMESWNSLDVPLVAEAKVGQSWGSLESYVEP
jgi:uracil-DNA glycosylase family 4